MAICSFVFIVGVFITLVVVVVAVVVVVLVGVAVVVADVSFLYVFIYSFIDRYIIVCYWEAPNNNINNTVSAASPRGCPAGSHQ